MSDVNDVESVLPLTQPHSATQPSGCGDSSDGDYAVSSDKLLEEHESEICISMHWTDGGEGDDMMVCATADDTANDNGEEEMDCNDELVENRRVTLSSDLAFWAVKKRISQQAVKELLALLTFHDVPALPKDPRTLLKTPRTIEVKAIPGGHYYHFGIMNSVRCAALNDNLPLFDDCILELQLNIDGLPTAKSTNDQLWPILGRVTVKKLSRTYTSAVFVIALFFGESKPACAKGYLDEFVDEYNGLKDRSFAMLDVRVRLVITSIMTDAPANAFVKCIKGHGGYNSCPKCEVSCDSVDNRVVYPGVRGRLRTDDSFNVWTPHRSIDNVSPFVRAGLGMISAFPVDYMHALVIGLMKKLILLWLYLLNPQKMDKDWRAFMSDRLVEFRSTCPSEFARRPRSLKDLERWKATELRAFLCYLGVAVCRGLIRSEAYEHFLLLVCASRLLLHPTHCKEHNAFAGEMMRKFVAKFPSLYGRKYMSYNAHVIVHLPEDAKLHGNLNLISSFPYESYLHEIRQMVRKPGATLVQVVKRIYEGREFQLPNAEPRYSRARCQGEHVLGPLPPSVQNDNTVQQFEIVAQRGMKFAVKGRDRVVHHPELGVGHIVNLYKAGAGPVIAVLVVYKEQDDLFTQPMPSSAVGIHRVDGLCRSKYSAVTLSSCTKVWLMPMASYCVAVEVLSCME